MFIGAENMEDVTEEKIRGELSKAQAQAPTQWVRRSSRSADKEELVVSHLQYMMWPSEGDRDFNMYVVTVKLKETVKIFLIVCLFNQKIQVIKNDAMFFLQGTNYRKTNAAMEMRLINRESFWARAEVCQSVEYVFFNNKLKSF